MARPVLLALVAVALLLAGAGGARAGDVVVLANGVRLEGRIVSEDERSLVFERSSGGGRTTMTIPKDRIQSVQKGAIPDPSPAGAAGPVRDEWWLLRSDGKTIGTRHLLLLRREEGGVTGWHFEEDVVFLPQGRLPGARVQRIEDTTEDFRPLAFHYREQGEAGPAFQVEPYETIRTGPVRDGVWEMTQRGHGAAASSRVPLPAQARGPLSAREALARARPRPVGLVEMPVVDVARGEVRTVRAGFVGIDVGGAADRQDVLRVEDGDRALESRWGPGDPPKCVREEVAPGVVAVPCTREQAEAATAPPPAAPAPSPLEVSPTAPTGAKHLTLPEYGFDLTLPGASWEPDVVPARAEETGPKVVAKVTSRLLAADARIEWEPAKPGADPNAVEAALLVRLKGVCADLTVASPLTPVAGLPGAWRMTLQGTVRGERLRTLVLVAEGASGRATVLATCPETAWPDARAALEALLSSFRWL